MLILGYNEVTKNFNSVIVDKNVPEGEHFVRGDPTDKNTLLRAGIMKEDTLIVALDNDDDAIFAVLLAKHLNPRIKIGAIVKKEESMEKMYRAGADYVLLESEILSSEILRFLLSPQVASFLDRIILTRELEITGFPVPEEYVGKRIRDTDIRRKIGTVIGVKRGGKLIKNPRGDFVLKKGDILLFLLERKEINKIREMMGRWISRRD